VRPLLAGWSAVSAPDPPLAAPGRGRLRRSARGIVADITPLRASADYRRLWFGITVSQLGQQMTAVAVAIQVFTLTESSFAVGLVGLFSLVPLIVFGLYGGSVVDAYDRRVVVLVSSTGLWLTSLLFAAQALLDLRSVGLLYALVAVQGGLFAVNNPARSAIVPRLLPTELLPAANALSTVSWNLGFTAGPLLGGVVIKSAGFETAYLLDALTFTAALYAAWRLPRMPPLGDRRRAGVAAVVEGLRFLRTRPNVLMTFLVDMCAMVLAQPRALFPALALTAYGGGARTAGLLYASPAIGALAGALLSGWLGRIHRQGKAVLWSVVVYGFAIVGFGVVDLLWLAVVLLAVSGAADMVSAVFRTTILQAATPDELRGRLQGVFVVVVAGGPRLGDFTAGSVAALTAETVAIVAGGLACVAGVVMLAVRFPRFAGYDSRHPEP